MANELVVKEQGGMAVAQEERSVAEVIAQMHKVQALMADAMHPGEHYGVIPGTERKDKDGKILSKPTLLKPGAEKLCFLFRLAPSYEHKVLEREGLHLTVESTCTLVHINSRQLIATGSGLCSTHESKYAWRKASRACPSCGKSDTIIKGKAEYGGGWLCFDKKGGCKAKFKDGDPAIEGQEVGRTVNEDLPDQWNTIIKMADKRALIAAVLNGTAASDIFTQDLEDLAGKMPVEPPPTPDPTPEPKPEPKTAGSGVSGAKAAIPAAAPTPDIETTATTLEDGDVPPAGDFKDATPANAGQKKWFEQCCTQQRFSPVLALGQRGRKAVDELTVGDIAFFTDFFQKRAAKRQAA